MTDREYPRIGNTQRIPPHWTRGVGKCRCGEKAKYKVDIQHSIFRGDDDVQKACEAHKRDVDFLIGRGK